MGDEKLPRDIARSHADQGELHNPLSNAVGQRPSINKDTAQLIDSCLTCNNEQFNLSILNIFLNILHHTYSN